jgi:hypothetical protein
MIERYVSGERAFELAAAFDVHRSTIADLVQRTGVRRSNRLTDDEISRAAALYDEDWSCGRIGEELGRDPKSVWGVLQRAGVQFRDTHGRERPGGAAATSSPPRELAPVAES